MSSVADALEPILAGFLGEDLPVRFHFWDGSEVGHPDAKTELLFRTPMALRRLIYAPTELGMGRAYVSSDIEITGDVFDLLSLRDRLADPKEHTTLDLGRDRWLKLVRAAGRLGALGPPPPRPPQEAGLRGRRHSAARDAAAIAHHYDVSNDFYRVVLGKTMTYSCAYFPVPELTVDEAQGAKYDLVCRKLGLGPGMRLLDVGCGWGGMVLHAAEHYGVDAVGVTVSQAQADLAEKRVAEAGLADRVQIRLQNYREITGERFDAISSIGMFEHVGLSELRHYFEVLHRVLEPKGRLLNHGISRPPGPSGFDKHSFIARYVFPDGELHEVGSTVSVMQEQGFEVRDVEALREHYARTLRCWVANLESNWDHAASLSGLPRARIWRLYMAGAALGFESGRINLHQVLAVKPDREGRSAMPATRASFVRS